MLPNTPPPSTPGRRPRRGSGDEACSAPNDCGEPWPGEADYEPKRISAIWRGSDPDRLFLRAPAPVPASGRATAGGERAGTNGSLAPIEEDVESLDGEDLRGFMLPIRCSDAAPKEEGSRREEGVRGAAEEGGERSMLLDTRRTGGEGPERRPAESPGESMAGQSDLSLGRDRPVWEGSRCARIAAASSICTCWCLDMLSCVGSFQCGLCSQRCFTRQDGWRYSCHISHSQPRPHTRLQTQGKGVGEGRKEGVSHLGTRLAFKDHALSPPLDTTAARP